MDLRKAFDSVWRNGLYHKLLKLGIGGKFYNLIKNTYSTNAINIKQNNSISVDNITSYKGVKQGDIMSPILFNLYINDLTDIFNSTHDPVELNGSKINFLAYADDIVLLSQSSEGLQNCLNSFHRYCEKWKLEINSSKSKIMIFWKNKRHLNQYKFKILNETLENSTEFKYLGILFSYTGNIKYAANELYKKALKAYFKMFEILKYNGEFSIKLYLKLFDMLIRPILTYNAEIWIWDWLKNKKNKNIWNFDLFPCDKLNHKMCKHLLGIHKKSSNIASRLELGRFPIAFYIYKQSFKYYKRLQIVSPDRLLFDAFTENITLEHKNYNSWTSYISHIEKTLNTNFNILNNNSFENLLEQSYTQECRNILMNINTKRPDSNIYMYSHFDFDNKMKNYLELKTNKDLRSLFTKFRLRSHGLQIETDRYKTPTIPINNRKCSTCNVVNDETHMIFHCKKFDDTRKNIFSVLTKQDDYLNLIPVNGSNMGNIYKSLEVFLNPKYLSAMTQIGKLLKHIINNAN